MRSKIVITLFFLLSISIICSFPVQAAGQATYTRLAIVPFKNLTGDKDKNWLGEGIAESVATELGTIKGLILIERSQLAKAVEGFKLSQSGLLEENTLIKVGKLTSAKYLVVGSYQMVEGDILLNARLIDVESGGIKQAARVKGDFKNVFDLQDSLARSTLTWINVTPAPVELEKMKASTVQDVSILEFLSRAREAYYAGRNDETEEWIKKALAVDPSRTDAIMLQGNLHERLGRNREALARYISASEMAGKRNERKGYSKALSSIGSILHIQGRNDEAVQYYNRSLDVSRTIGDEKGVAVAINGMGRVYHAQGRLDLALGSWKEALAISERSGDEHYMGALLLNIGSVLADQDRNDEALSYCHRSLVINNKIGAVNMVAVAHSCIGDIYSEQKRYGLALTELNESLAMNRAMGEQSGAAWTLKHLGTLFYRQSRYEEAIAYYNQSLEISRRIGEERLSAIVVDNMGRIYHSTGRYAAARNSYREAVALYEKIGNPQLAEAVRALMNRLPR